MRAFLIVALLGACHHSSEPVKTGGGGGSTNHGGVPDGCASNDDCELVAACCGCNSGGKNIAIRKDAVDAFNQSRPERCGGQMCAQHISNDASCSAEAVCGSDGHCKVAPHAGMGDPNALPPVGAPQ